MAAQKPILFLPASPHLAGVVEMTFSRKDLRDRLAQRLFETSKSLPVTRLSRLGLSAKAVLGGGRLMLADKLFGGRDLENLDQLPDIEALLKIVGSMGELKGITMKMGQIMSYIDVAIPDELREALAVLQTHAQPMPFEQVRQIISTELGEKGAFLVEKMDPVPIAAASIGQVHRSRLDDGTEVAVKVQYPGISQAIKTDFSAANIGTKIASMLFPGAHIDDLVNEASRRFLEECDYEHEAACQNQFYELYINDTVLVIPPVHTDFCSMHVLTTTFCTGIHFDEFLQTAPSQEARDRLGKALFDFYIGSLFRHRIYNCDPHPGNYLFLPDQKIAILDYGCVRRFEPEMVKKMARLTLAVHDDDPDRLRQCFLELNMVHKARAYDFDTARRLVRAFFGTMLEDKVQKINLDVALSMREVAKGKRELLKISIPGEFLFLFRIRFGLMSILAKLESAANWYQLEREYAIKAIEK